ncbi:hypothetical protein B0G73_112161 [Paraburkholderia sp. BL25I1N1]|nr:hypothetical protein B0G73_112161 [Paraburkholderia sp. BL25I1N1]
MSSEIDLIEIEHILVTVERGLRQQFPFDFHERCAYASYAIRALLKDAGTQSELVGGDFLAFVVSTDNRRAGVQGFAFGEQQCSHFWVETDDRIVDLGPFFLPRESSYPAVSMPAVAWKMSYALPHDTRRRMSSYHGRME